MTQKSYGSEWITNDNNDNTCNFSDIQTYNTQSTQTYHKMHHCDAKNLINYIGKEVCIIGMSMNVTSTPFSSTFMASDGDLFTVTFSKNNKKTQFDKRYNKICGIVDKDGTLQYKSHQSIGDSFCFWTWNKILLLMHKYPNLI